MKKILIVDDNLQNIFLLEAVLMSNDFILETAKNGKEALDKTEEFLPDLIISDILMPVMDGYTFCIEVKRKPKLKETPFIFYTATYTSTADRDFALKLGADEFLIKPLEPEAFLSAVQDVMNRLPGMNKSVPKSSPGPSIGEDALLREYNSVLISKLEDKMIQTERAETELRSYADALENEIKDRKKIEIELRESEERFSSFFKGAIFGLYRTNPKGRILLANRKLISMLGYSSFEELARRDLTIDGFEISSDRTKFMEEIEKHGEIHNWDDKWRRKDGTFIYVRESAKAIKNKEGKLVCYDGFVEDVTDIKIIEEELEKSRRLFQTLANVSPVGIFKADANGDTVYVNPRWCELSGLTSEEAKGIGWLKAVHPEDREVIMSEWEKASIEKTGSQAKYRFTKSDGKIIWVIGNAVPEYNNDEVIGYIGTITDVTELIEKENEIITLNCAIEQSPVLIILTNLNDEIVYVNPTFTSVTGFTAEEVIGQPAQILANDSLTELQLTDIQNKLKNGEIWNGEFYNQRKNGEFFWESLTISTILNSENEPIHYLIIGLDVTDKKINEQELIRAKEKAEVMNTLKSNLLANLSHELRTPLISVLGFSELIKEIAENQQIVNMAVNIKHGGSRLLMTLNNLLQFSRIEKEHIVPLLSDLDINETIACAMDLHQTEAEIKGLTLISELSPGKLICKSDRVLVADILSNLIQNAIKFTFEGKVLITSETAGNSIIITVSDTGIGIPDDVKSLIFEAFRQASEGYTRAYEGTGLGLTIAKSFAEALNGTISYESKLNEGSKFTLTLPLIK
ncbi:MAG: PAS domain S-box protein [Ignavibacteriaceae bacterium]|nr:PAS domain S-box protein [Ignavibacteriaceae bacterium]